MNRYQNSVRGSLGLAALSLLTFLSFLLMTHKLQATPNQHGKILRVVAHSGLSLRTHPGVQHETLLVIPYGHEVEMVDDQIFLQDQLAYIPGIWIKVDYHGLKGYVFDAYVTSLAPINEPSELDVEKLSIPEQMYKWAIYNLDPDYVDEDSVHCEMEDSNHYLETFVNGQSIRMLLTDQIVKSILTLHEVRVMEVYHLVLSMIPTGHDYNEYVRNTIIIHNDQGAIKEIRIHGETEVKITLVDSDMVRLSAQLSLDHMVTN